MWISWLSVLFVVVAAPLSFAGALMMLYGGGQWGRWAYLLHQFLGQSVPRADDRRGLRTDAGTAVASGSHRLRSGTSLHSSRALLETRSSGGRFGTARRAAFTSGFPVSRSLSSSGLELGRSNWRSSPAVLSRKFLLVTLCSRCLSSRQNLTTNLANGQSSCSTKFSLRRVSLSQ